MARSSDVDLDEFLRTVRARADDLDSREAAIGATNAVLAELGGYVTGAAAERLVGAVPDAFRRVLRDAPAQAAGGDSGAFFSAVAARERLDDETVAAGHVQAVLRAVAEHADDDALRAVQEQLTAELRVLLAADEREGDTSQRLAAGPIDPEAPNVAGPERPVRRDDAR